MCVCVCVCVCQLITDDRFRANIALIGLIPAVIGFMGPSCDKEIRLTHTHVYIYMHIYTYTDASLGVNLISLRSFLY